MIVPPSLWVCALKALQNSMMLTPCWPSAGPTGSAGLALPAWICSLMRVRTFLAIAVQDNSWRENQAIQGRRERGVLRTRATEDAGARRLSRQLDLLDLVVVHLDRRLAAEDRDQHLEFGGVLVDLGDLAGEIGERAGDDLDRLADRELGLGAGALGGLAVQQPG